MFIESWILRVSCKVNVKPIHDSIRASINLQENRSIHDTMNIPKSELIS